MKNGWILIAFLDVLLPGVYLISDWALKSCPTIFKSIFPFEKTHNDFEAMNRERTLLWLITPLPFESISKHATVKSRFMPFNFKMAFWGVISMHTLQVNSFIDCSTDMAILSVWYLTFRNALFVQILQFPLCFLLASWIGSKKHFVKYDILMCRVTDMITFKSFYR